MNSQEVHPKFDIRVENTKRFLAPLQKKSQQELDELQVKQQKYEAAMSKGVVVRSINKIFRLVKDRTADISDSESELQFYQKFTDMVQAEQYDMPVEYLSHTLDILITQIEKLQRHLGGKPLRWSTVEQATGLSLPHLFLTQGVTVLNQLDPAAAESINQRLANMIIDKASVDLRK